MKSRTSPVSAVTALSPDTFVTARSEVPEITERTTVLSGFAWAASRERNASALSIRLPWCFVTMKLLGVDRLLFGLQVAPNCVQRVCDGAREGEQRRHDECRDHSQDDAVLGHRLALLDAEARAEISDHVSERHDGFTPLRVSRALSAPVRAVVLEVVEVESTGIRANMWNTPLTSFLS